MTELTPYALKDAPALIEKVFPAQKVSFEAQRERKAGAGQTLTALGSYWKGRKPLILVRSIVLGCLLPQTDDTEKDLELFEALMAFDNQGLGRRAVAQNAIKPSEIAERIELAKPWDYFSFSIPKHSTVTEDEVENWQFPLCADEQQSVRITWKRGLSDEAKARCYAKALLSYSTYQERALLCKRPEEIDPNFLYAPALVFANQHLAQFGIHAASIQDLVEQLGIFGIM